MPIAAISSSFVSAVRTSATVQPVGPVVARPVAERTERDAGRRHQLVDAMYKALGVDAAPSKDEAQAVLHFAHALMHELRSAQMQPATGAGRGLAWGRRDASDLRQRIAALAAAIGGPATTPHGTADAPAPDSPATGASATSQPVAPSVAADDAAARAALPQPSTPVTSISTGVALMRVPSSRLIEAYAAMRAALGDEVPASDELRAGLSGLLDRLAKQLAPDTPAAWPPGGVLSVTA
jgi:hypothetical protein